MVENQVASKTSQAIYGSFKQRCKDYSKYSENVQLRILLENYKKLCGLIKITRIYCEREKILQHKIETREMMQGTEGRWRQSRRRSKHEVSDIPLQHHIFHFGGNFHMQASPFSTQLFALGFLIARRNHLHFHFFVICFSVSFCSNAAYQFRFLAATSMTSTSLSSFTSSSSFLPVSFFLLPAQIQCCEWKF